MPHRWTAADLDCMSRALELARRGEGAVEPNPMVGCVLVKAGRVVGEGYHRRYGGPHAEVDALRRAGRAARGATAYVTLEPCCHQGKTPPCTGALIAAGVWRVVAAMVDPNPLVRGKGLRLLKRAGIAVKVGLMKLEAEALNAPFITRVTRQRPFVILKWAQSLDGKIATRTGDSKWISSRQSRAAAHALRARVDAIIVGVETVVRDDPLLTARYVPRRRVARRIVLDPSLRTPASCRFVRSARRVPTLIIAGDDMNRSARRRRLEAAGCEVWTTPLGRSGLDLPALLRELHRRGMTNVLVEGGGRTLGSFLEAGLADEARIFVAPMLIGGERAPGPLRNLGPAHLRRVRRPSVVEQLAYGPDTCYTVRFD